MQRPLARLAQVEEPGLRCSEARSRRGLGTMTDILLRKAQAGRAGTHGHEATRQAAKQAFGRS